MNIGFYELLGFLGLLGLVILILIYILKPNYQQKMVSSSHVWKLSLKYKKRRLPVSRFKQLLIIICQILVISVSAFILAGPYMPEKDKLEQLEKIIIIDASASMLANKNNVTRFDKAVSQAKQLGQETLEKEGIITLIFAGKKAQDIYNNRDYHITKADKNITVESMVADFTAALDEVACTYGIADIDGAMLLAEDILADRPFSDVILYTATTYADIGENIEVIDLSEKDEDGKKTEWNAAILDVTAVLEENYYTITVTIASYNQNKEILVYCQAEDVNSERIGDEYIEPINVTAVEKANCMDDERVDVTFRNFDNLRSPQNENGCIFSYATIHIYIDAIDMADDTFSYDNDFYIYGGTKETLNILYVSSLRNTFFGSALRGLRDMLRSRWTLNIKEASLDDEPAPELSGYDFYIFEHVMPRTLPVDGVILLSNPNTTPVNLNGVIVGGSIGDGNTLVELSKGDFFGDSGKIINYIAPEKIKVSLYSTIVSYEGYETLLLCDGDPVLLVKDEPYEKVVILSFGLNYSNLSMLLEFPILMRNMFDNFFPPTLTEYVYDVDAPVILNARGESLDVSGPGLTDIFYEFPCEIFASEPGTYTLTQQLTLKSDAIVTDNFFIRIAASESDFSKIETFTPPNIPLAEYEDRDLLIYLAIALVSFLFIERLLHIKDEF